MNYLLLISIPLVLAEKFAIPKASKKYVQMHSLCSWYGHCIEGTQGICHPGQVFVELDRSSPFEPLVEDAGCLVKNHANCISGGVPILIDGESDPSAKISVGTGSGICVWSRSDHPCKGYPASYRWYPEHKKCYPVVSSGDLNHVADKKQNPCKRRQKFYSIDSKTGTCDCKDVEDIYWPRTDECYRMNSQGPCNTGQWIALDRNRQPRCVRTSCPADGDHVFFEEPLNGKPGCYKLESDEACKIDDGIRAGLVLRTKIFPEKIACSFPVSFSVSTNPILLSSRACSPGSKRAFLKLCKVSY